MLYLRVRPGYLDSTQYQWLLQSLPNSSARRDRTRRTCLRLLEFKHESQQTYACINRRRQTGVFSRTATLSYWTYQLRAEVRSGSVCRRGSKLVSEKTAMLSALRKRETQITTASGFAEVFRRELQCYKYQLYMRSD